MTDILHFEYPHVPQGYRTFKCSTPGCREFATMMVDLRHTLAHLPNHRRCFCGGCGWEAVKREAEITGDAFYDLVVDSAPTGLFLYRAKCDAPGGWRGWRYMVALRRENILERACPNPWALRDGDGNFVVRDSAR